MKRKRALLKYGDAPPSETGLEVEVYLADEVDAVIKRQAAEVADLRAFINGMKRHIEAAAAMYGVKRS